MVIKNKWKIKSENYFVCITIKWNKKDRGYYDIIFGLKREKSHEMHAHYWIKVGVKDNMIGGEICFIKSRQATSNYREKTFNAKTGEFLSELEMPFKEFKGETGAEMHISTEWDDEAQKLFIKEVKIIEKILTK